MYGLIYHEYYKRILFLGRISELNREGAGLANSWSWIESNFHSDDVTDLSYTDPSFTPSYSLNAFSQQQILTAEMVCSAQGLRGSLLDGCIFDIVITNDQSFAQQEALQIGKLDLNRHSSFFSL